MKSYIYEITLSNGKKLTTRDIKEVVDFCNDCYKDNECFKQLTPSIMRNCIYLNKLPKIFTDFKRTDYNDFFSTEFKNRYEDKQKLSQRTKNRLVNNIYNDFRLSEYEKNMKKMENYEVECEVNDNVNIWNGEDNDNSHIVG